MEETLGVIGNKSLGSYIIDVQMVDESHTISSYGMKTKVGIRVLAVTNIFRKQYGRFVQMSYLVSIECWKLTLD